MHILARFTLVGAAAVTLLCSLVAVASAADFSLSNRNIRAVWRTLTFEAKETQLFQPGQIRCAVTMEGSFHSVTLPKVANMLYGFITRAIAGHPCVGGEYFFHNGTEVVLGNPANSLPWHMTYSEFRGRLPIITEVIVNLIGMRMTVDYGLNKCLEVYGSATESRRWNFSLEPGGGVISFQPITEPRHLITWQGVNMLCPELGKLSGASGLVTLLGTTNQISIRLI
jgi:hypothetical protein